MPLNRFSLYCCAETVTAAGQLNRATARIAKEKLKRLRFMTTWTSEGF